MQDILLSDIETDADEDSDEDDYIREMLKDHVEEKKVRAKYYQNPHVSVTWVVCPGVCVALHTFGRISNYFFLSNSRNELIHLCRTRNMVTTALVCSRIQTFTMNISAR